MADITLCQNKDCPVKQRCFRYTAEASNKQSYAFFPHKNGKCDYFWDNSYRKIQKKSADYKNILKQ